MTTATADLTSAQPHSPWPAALTAATPAAANSGSQITPAKGCKPHDSASAAP
jgi:hypothetical protein